MSNKSSTCVLYDMDLDTDICPWTCKSGIPQGLESQLFRLFFYVLSDT